MKLRYIGYFPVVLYTILNSSDQIGTRSKRCTVSIWDILEKHVWCTHVYL